MIQLDDKYNRTIYFDDAEHKYTDDQNNIYTSTTTLIHQFEVPFDTKAWARRLAKEGRGQYTGKSEKEIIAQWEKITKDACDKGTAKHDNLETNIKIHSKFYDTIKSFKRNDNVLYTIDDIIKNNISGRINIEAFTEALNDRYPKIVAIIEWYVEKGYHLYAEVGVYDPTYLISGMIDLLAIKDDSFVILDWKTNKDEIKFESGYYKKNRHRQLTNLWVSKKEYLKYPIDNLYNCNGMIYSLQLNTYAKMLIDRGFKFKGAILIQIRDTFVLNEYGMPKVDNKGQYIVVEDEPERVDTYVINDYQKEVSLMFDYHFKTNLANRQLKIF